nr:hypothetical protein [Nannocystis sp.]
MVGDAAHHGLDLVIVGAAQPGPEHGGNLVPGDVVDPAHTELGALEGAEAAVGAVASPHPTRRRQEVEVGPLERERRQASATQAGAQQREVEAGAVEGRQHGAGAGQGGEAREQVGEHRPLAGQAGQDPLLDLQAAVDQHGDADHEGDRPGAAVEGGGLDVEEDHRRRAPGWGGASEQTREHRCAAAAIGELEAGERAAQERRTGLRVRPEDDAAQVAAAVGAEVMRVERGRGARRDDFVARDRGIAARRRRFVGDRGRLAPSRGCDGARRQLAGERDVDAAHALQLERPAGERDVDAAHARQLERPAGGPAPHEQAVDAVPVGGAASAELGRADQALGGAGAAGARQARARRHMAVQRRFTGCWRRGCPSGQLDDRAALTLRDPLRTCPFGQPAGTPPVKREAVAQAHAPASRSACSRCSASLRSSARRSIGRSIGATGPIPGPTPAPSPGRPT